MADSSNHNPSAGETELLNHNFSWSGDKHIVLNDSEKRSGLFSLYELWASREVLLFLIYRDLKVRYKQTALGAAWAIVQPLLMMLVFAVFFGIWVGVPTDGMPHLLFFYSGLLPWTFFANSVADGSQSLLNNSHVITKVHFPRIIIPMAAVCIGLVDLLIASTILFGLSLYYRVPLTLNLLTFPVLLCLTVLLASSWSIATSVLVVKYRDLRHVLPFVLQLCFFITPIIYPLDVIPTKWRWFFRINPMSVIVEGVRRSLLGSSIDSYSLLIAAALSIIAFLTASFMFSRVEREIIDII